MSDKEVTLATDLETDFRTRGDGIVRHNTCQVSRHESWNPIVSKEAE